MHLFVVQPLNRLMERFKTKPDVATSTKECPERPERPECLSRIPHAATRCAFCTVEQLV